MIVAIIMIKMFHDDFMIMKHQQETTTETEISSKFYIEENTTSLVSMADIIKERATAEPTTAESTTETEMSSICIVAPAVNCNVDIDDFNLMCRVVMNEAGGNSFKCQLAVAETIVNRVNSEKFPNNIYDVVYQPYQYSHANNGDVTDSVREAVTQALEESTFDNSMVFFRDWYYHGFAEPYMEIDDMCFSLKKE